MNTCLWICCTCDEGIWKAKLSMPPSCRHPVLQTAGWPSSTDERPPSARLCSSSGSRTDSVDTHTPLWHCPLQLWDNKGSISIATQLICERTAPCCGTVVILGVQCAEFLFLLHNALTCLIRHIATQLLKQKANYQEYTQQRPKTTENDIRPVPFFTRNKVKLYFLKGRLVSKQLLICSSSNHRATISLIWSQGSGHLMMKQSQSNIPFFQLRFLALWLLGAHLCWRSSNCVCLLLDAEQVMYSRAFSQQHLLAAPENIATRVC